MVKITVLYVGTTYCSNCSTFKPEWEKFKTMIAGQKVSIPGVELEVEEHVVGSHEALPLPLQNTVTFYPFIMILPSEYYETSLRTADDDLVLVGDAMYTYRTMKNGKLQYKLGGSVNDSPSMRYPRTALGIVDWVTECGMTSLQTLAAKYYPEIDFELPDTNNGLKMRALQTMDNRLEMFIPPLNKEYQVVPGGMVMCRRILNVHS